MKSTHIIERTVVSVSFEGRETTTYKAELPESVDIRLVEEIRKSVVDFDKSDKTGIIVRDSIGPNAWLINDTLRNLGIHVIEKNEYLCFGGR